MATGTVTLLAQLVGTPNGSVNIAPTAVALSAVVFESILVTLASGANTVTVPTGATYVCIKPPAGNTVALTLKGVTGDTGVGIHPSNPSMFALASSQASFVITAASAVSAGDALVSFC